MEIATLDDFMALNDQLAALQQAGVPLDVDLGPSGVDAAGNLERINAIVARRVSQGVSLADALQSDDSSLPTSYRNLVQLGLYPGNIDTALESSHRLAKAADDSWHAVRLSLLYPIVVCCLAYVGLIGFCLFFVPTLENLYASLEIQSRSNLQVLQSLRDTLPYWVAWPPGALLLLLVWRFRPRELRRASQSRRDLSWLPGMSRAMFQQRCAIFAQTLATLIDSGMPLDEGLQLAAGACGDANLSEAARTLAMAMKQGQTLGDDSPTALRFPPFLRWALWHAEAITGKGRALRMTASLYRESAERRVERLRIVAPIVTCAILGGGVTLLYGLALFLPVVEMLRGLAG